VCRGAVHRQRWRPADSGDQELYRAAHSLGDDRAVPAKERFQVQPQTNIATVISRNAMINKQIDMTWEYTGTS
jgi:hypothetical protein